MADLCTSSYTTKENETTGLLAPSFSRFQVFSILEDLPREILADIFTIACHDTLYGFFQDKYRYKRTTPFLLGHVCSEWRIVVWSTPEIWSHVALYLTLEKEDIQVALLEEWLSRSGEYPLTITIELEDEDGWTEKIPEKLLRLLCSCASRWQSISWTLPESWYPILKKIEDSFSLLSTMSTGILFDHSEGRKQFDLFSRAPALRDVGLLNGFWISDVDLPWNQLIRLTLQRVFIDECLAVLSRTSQLKFLSLQEVLEDPDLLQDQQIELQALEHLVINESPWRLLSLFLSRCTAPLLRKFEYSPLTGTISRHDNIISTLKSLATDLGCRLTALRLSGLVFDQQRLPVLYHGEGEQEATMTISSKERTSDVIKFLHGFPSLQDLELDLINPSLPSSDILIKILEPHISSLDEIDQNLLPNLQRLVFSGPIFLKNGFEELLYKTLQDRDVTGIATTEKDVRPLLFFELKSKEYHTYPYTTFTPEDREKYTSLVANGMHLKIMLAGQSWI